MIFSDYSSDFSIDQLNLYFELLRGGPPKNKIFYNQLKQLIQVWFCFKSSRIFDLAHLLHVVFEETIFKKIEFLLKISDRYYIMLKIIIMKFYPIYQIITITSFILVYNTYMLYNDKQLEYRDMWFFKISKKTVWEGEKIFFLHRILRFFDM